MEENLNSIIMKNIIKETNKISGILEVLESCEEINKDDLNNIIKKLKTSNDYIKNETKNILPNQKA